MKKHTFVQLMLISVLVLASLPTFAQQTTGQIEGTIFDAQGAALVGAEITVTDPNTAFTRTTISGSSGNYSIPLLPPGTYNLAVKAKGFAGVEQKDITIVVGQILTLNENLKPGAANEVVEVSGASPLIETTSTQI